MFTPMPKGFSHRPGQYNGDDQGMRFSSYNIPKVPTIKLFENTPGEKRNTIVLNNTE